MEKSKMTFNELWEQAEAEHYASKLASEYPAWRTQRRHTAGMVAGIALILAVATPMMLTQSATGNSEKVYCNNAAYDDNHWVDMADELLMTA